MAKVNGWLDLLIRRTVIVWTFACHVFRGKTTGDTYRTMGAVASLNGLRQLYHETADALAQASLERDLLRSNVTFLGGKLLKRRALRGLFVLVTFVWGATAGTAAGVLLAGGAQLLDAEAEQPMALSLRVIREDTVAQEVRQQDWRIALYLAGERPHRRLPQNDACPSFDASVAFENDRMVMEYGVVDVDPDAGP